MSDAISNGDTFDQVEERLSQKYDQPQEFYAESLKALMKQCAIRRKAAEIL